MANYRTTRLIPSALILALIVVAIVGLVYAAHYLFFSGNNIIPQSDNSQAALLNTDANRAVRLIVRGNIVADEDFRTYQIQISPNQRVLTLFKGYEEQAYDNITLYNNNPAYEQLVYALNRAKMMNSPVITGEANDTRGICATGFLYTYQILKDGNPQKTLWTTSCGNARGSQRNATTPINNLFIVQIPGAQEKIGNLW